MWTGERESDRLNYIYGLGELIPLSFALGTILVSNIGHVICEFEVWRFNVRETEWK